MIRAPRGTNDILPPESHRWIYLETLLRNLSEIYNFEEVRTPMFEHTELFFRTVGETTDIVQKEMYTFQDKGGRDLTLRPEGTAPVVRAFLERGLDGGVLPRKLFYLGPMFRYEKPQAGRYREFVQFGIETLGSFSPYSDAEVILFAIRIAEELGLLGTTLFINTIGCSVCRKDHKKDLIKYISGKSEELCPDCVTRLDTNPLRVLDCKHKKCQKIVKNAPSIQNYLCYDCAVHWNSLKNILTSSGLEYTVDPTLVRGLDYYTRTVFELKWPPLGAQDTIIGGGRYDGLVEELGGKPCPGVGFALGVERLLIASEKGEKPIEPQNFIECFVIILKGANEQTTEEISDSGFKLLSNLRHKGLTCDFDPLRRSIRAQMKHANRFNAKFVAIIGEKEIEQNVVTVRSMEHGWQKQICADNASDFIKEEILGGSK